MMTTTAATAAETTTDPAMNESEERAARLARLAERRSVVADERAAKPARRSPARGAKIVTAGMSADDRRERHRHSNRDSRRRPAAG